MYSAAEGTELGSRAGPGGVLSAPELSALAAARPPPEDFGPQSTRPYVAVELEGTDPALGAWLQSLPCPVIGIGQGALSAACDVVLGERGALAAIARNVSASPLAAMVLVQHLRAGEGVSPDRALTLESFAYATVQNGPEFRGWHLRRCEAGCAAGAPAANGAGPLLIARQGEKLRITLNRPQSRNAIGMEMRDALVEALRLALLDTDIRCVELDAHGACFSVGGDLAEFGQASDPATAHWVRTLRLPARHALSLADRLRVRVNGAAIGAGVELACFATRVTATPDAWFQLPELKYGLIPGAGGTVSLSRRIGRARTAYMALSMRRVSAATALGWGMIDAIES
jgi:enoyl-CoA hydratase